MRKSQITKKQMEAIHPRIPDVYSGLKQGRISRREFLRTVSLLGMTASTALIAAQCGSPAGSGAPAAPAESAASDSGSMGGVKRGGIIRVGVQVQAADHPARLSWTEPADVFRGSWEYLTFTDYNNITSPYMLDSYMPSEDLTEWTLNLRQDITWSNGDQFNADDVIFNFNEWLNPDTGSSILGFFEGFLTTNDIERVDDFTVKLHLAAPKLDVPENLFHYPAQIVHRSFDGDALSGNNPVTGPFTITEYNVGENARLEAREGYWRNGADGSPLPYVDAIEYIDLGDDATAYVAAIASGEIDYYEIQTADSFLALRNNESINVSGTPTAQVRVLRFRVDQEPWNDVRLINAVKMCQDRTKILNSAYFGEGLEGHDIHVAPVHPEFAPMDLPAYDPEGAKALLAEAGQDGLAFSISVGTGWTDVVSYAEILQQDAKAAGIDITLDTMPTTAYWDLWTETAVGITPWTHRPLGVMVLPLAYIGDSDGNPVPWNESRWVNDEFSDLLKTAQGTFDLEARRAIMADLQKVMQEEGPVGISYWRNVWSASNPSLQEINTHPTGYRLVHNSWIDPDMDPFG